MSNLKNITNDIEQQRSMDEKMGLKANETSEEMLADYKSKLQKIDSAQLDLNGRPIQTAAWHDDLKNALPDFAGDALEGIYDFFKNTSFDPTTKARVNYDYRQQTGKNYPNSGKYTIFGNAK